MIPELGHFALILALSMAVIQSIFPLAGAVRGNLYWLSLARPAARGQFVFLAIAFAALVYAFIANDFTVAYVANNSNTQLPTAYRISAVWGAHEGSLLLWVFIMSAWTVAVTFFSKNLTEVFRARVIGIMGLCSVGFLLFLILTSNPFNRFFPSPVDGADLNPLLQDPGLIIHPPMLYVGYVGFSVVFAFAIAALLGKQLDSSWARWSRPWTTMAWVFLTLGIALGSWWAYYELGWGGWWFWDPVENASFMPWLAGTALIHSMAATEKRGVFKNWTVLLAICAFSLSLLGTFLVRSGVLTSVHAFASDPARGIFILVLLTIVIGGSLLLYAIRAPGTLSGGRFELFSRETFLLINSVLLSVALASILLGTLYPLIAEALGMGKLSVGAPYFNAVFIPLMTPVAIVLGFGVLTRWRTDDFKRVWERMKMILTGSIIIGVGAISMLADTIKFQTIFGVSLAIWIVWTTLYAMHDRLRHQKYKWFAVYKLPSSFIGMCFAHIGFAITITGVCLTSHYSIELHERMGEGDSIDMSGYTFTLDELRDLKGPNYNGMEAVFEISRNGKVVASLNSQKRIYTVRNMPMTEAGIDGSLFRDLYVSMGEPLDNGDWSVRLYYRPFVRWLWFGAIFMGVGGIFAAFDKRYRIKSRQTASLSVRGEPSPGSKTASIEQA
jgi:cytochrome c-type biogenesis protein CcmF